VGDPSGLADPRADRRGDLNERFLPTVFPSVFTQREAPGTPVAPGVAEEPPSFEAFFSSAHARLFGTLCVVTADAGEAEELMQEAFVRVWERWDRVRFHPDPAGYLYLTAFNVHRDRMRRLRRAARLMVSPVEAEDVFARVDERADVLDALRRLSARQRAALVLTELLDMSSEQAGRVLGVRAVTVRVLASQGRAALREALEGSDV
jgi:RNA polymerase sigma-70 factor (ECF subfamily)